MARTFSVVVTTYEWPEALDAVLRGLAGQSDNEFEVVVADDGSGSATADVVGVWATRFAGRLTHAWQPDEGFRLARVRNLGAVTATGDYLVFVDGDCVPRRHFVAAIRRAAFPGWFLASKRAQLSADLSNAVLRGDASLASWSTGMLIVRERSQIVPWLNLTGRDRRRPWRPGLPDFAPHRNEYGFMMALSRVDFARVNGFDMRFVGWGDQDVDLAVRLRRRGLRCGWAGPDTTMLHLWHRGQGTDDRATWWLLKETEASNRIEALVGLDELAAELGRAPARSSCK